MSIASSVFNVMSIVSMDMTYKSVDFMNRCFSIGSIVSIGHFQWIHWILFTSLTMVYFIKDNEGGNPMPMYSSFFVQMGKGMDEHARRCGCPPPPHERLLAAFKSYILIPYLIFVFKTVYFSGNLHT